MPKINNRTIKSITRTNTKNNRMTQGSERELIKSDLNTSLRQSQNRKVRFEDEKIQGGEREPKGNRETLRASIEILKNSNDENKRKTGMPIENSKKRYAMEIAIPKAIETFPIYFEQENSISPSNSQKPELNTDRDSIDSHLFPPLYSSEYYPNPSDEVRFTNPSKPPTPSKPSSKSDPNSSKNKNPSESKRFLPSLLKSIKQTFNDELHKPSSKNNKDPSEVKSFRLLDFRKN